MSERQTLLERFARARDYVFKDSTWHERYMLARDYAFKGSTRVAMAANVGMFFVTAGFFVWGSRLAIGQYGLEVFSPLNPMAWNPTHEMFGMVGPILDTFKTSAIALTLAVPPALGFAGFLSELCPRWLLRPLVAMQHALASIPGVGIGAIGAFTVLPFVTNHLGPELQSLFHNVPVMSSLVAGKLLRGGSILATGGMLAIMVFPTIANTFYKSFALAPPELRQTARLLGYTASEEFAKVFHFALPAVFGGISLGLGRALGETMATIMMIGNDHRISASIVTPGSTVATTVANEFPGIVDNALQLSGVMELALTLIGIAWVTSAVNDRLSNYLLKRNTLKPPSKQKGRIKRLLLSAGEGLTSRNALSPDVQPSVELQNVASIPPAATNAAIPMQPDSSTGGTVDREPPTERRSRAARPDALSAGMRKRYAGPCL